MILETKRLRLRPWAEGDAESLYTYASDPAVGPAAGWPPHRSLAHSRQVLRDALQGPECYALCRKEDDRPIGAIELKLRGHTDMTDREDECELGYWLGRPFWGQGLMPEAVEALLRRAFTELDMHRVWAGYYAGNESSKRVQEKCGFRFQGKTEAMPVPLLGETRTGFVSSLTREAWADTH